MSVGLYMNMNELSMLSDRLKTEPYAPPSHAVRQFSAVYSLRPIQRVYLPIRACIETNVLLSVPLLPGEWSYSLSTPPVLSSNTVDEEVDGSQSRLRCQRV